MWLWSWLGLKFRFGISNMVLTCTWNSDSGFGICYVAVVLWSLVSGPGRTAPWRTSPGRTHVLETTYLHSSFEVLGNEAAHVSAFQMRAKSQSHINNFKTQQNTDSASHTSWSSTQAKASRGFEPRSLDSESRVLTVTPWGQLATEWMRLQQW